jgi:hypothetical protein
MDQTSESTSEIITLQHNPAPMRALPTYGDFISDFLREGAYYLTPRLLGPDAWKNGVLERLGVSPITGSGTATPALNRHKWVTRLDLQVGPWASRYQWIMTGRIEWLLRQLKRPESRATFGVSESELASSIAARLEVPSRWSIEPLSHPSLVSGQVSAHPPYEVDLRPYLEGEVFGVLAPARTSPQIVRPHLIGRIDAEGDESSTLTYRIDQYATALATVVLSAVGLVLIVGGLCGHFLGGTQWGELGLVIAFVGVLTVCWPLSFMTRFVRMIRYEQFLIQWVIDLGGTPS